MQEKLPCGEDWCVITWQSTGSMSNGKLVIAHVHLLLQGSCALRLHQLAKYPGSVKSYALVVVSVSRYQLIPFVHLLTVGNEHVN